MATTKSKYPAAQPKTRLAYFLLLNREIKMKDLARLSGIENSRISRWFKFQLELSEAELTRVITELHRIKPIDSRVLEDLDIAAYGVTHHLLETYFILKIIEKLRHNS